MRRAAATLAVVFASVSAAAAANIAPFSAMAPGGSIEPGWAPQTFSRIERHSRYALVRDGDAVVLRADADASASGMVHRLDGTPPGRTKLVWRWKIAAAVADGDATRRDADDFAARAYVTFRYEPQRVSALERVRYAMAKQLYGDYPPHAGLVYVWDARLAPGTVVRSPHSDRVRVIVLRSGNAEAGRWVEESRDVVEDYRRAFGEAPPPVSGVAVMTDTDQTGGRATAWFGDLRFVGAP